MKNFVVAVGIVACLAMGGYTQTWDSTGVDLSPYWNIDAWQVDENDADVPGAYCLDSSGTGGQRVRVWTLPEGVEGGQMNWTEDGTVQFLLPEFESGVLDGYLPDGSVIDVPNGNYERVFMALMSGNGAWPGSETDWAGTADEPYYEVNSFKPIYEDGEGDWIPIGLVNDWFWTPPEWVTPESGNPDEIVADWITHETIWEEFDYVWDFNADSYHAYSQTHRASGPDSFFTYRIPNPAGVDSAYLYITMWGNIHLEISTDDQNYEVLYDVIEDKGEPYLGRSGNMDGYEPNRDIYEFSLDEYLASGPEAIYLRFSDAAPNLTDDYPDAFVDNWGSICHHIGIFTGPVVRSRLGERLWPGLIREGGDAPQGGLILIKKSYPIDPERTLDKIQMPDNFTEYPRGDPYLTCFAVTLAVKGTAVEDYFLY